jgi:hypothetical protein
LLARKDDQLAQLILALSGDEDEQVAIHFVLMDGHGHTNVYVTHDKYMARGRSHMSVGGAITETTAVAGTPGAG